MKYLALLFMSMLLYCSQPTETSGGSGTEVETSITIAIVNDTLTESQITLYRIDSNKSILPIQNFKTTKFEEKKLSLTPGKYSILRTSGGKFVSQLIDTYALDEFQLILPLPESKVSLEGTLPFTDGILLSNQDTLAQIKENGNFFIKIPYGSQVIYYKNATLSIAIPLTIPSGFTNTIQLGNLHLHSFSVPSFWGSQTLFPQTGSKFEPLFLLNQQGIIPEKISVRIDFLLPVHLQDNQNLTEHLNIFLSRTSTLASFPSNIDLHLGKSLSFSTANIAEKIDTLETFDPNIPESTGLSNNAHRVFISNDLNSIPSQYGGIMLSIPQSFTQDNASNQDFALQFTEQRNKEL